MNLKKCARLICAALLAAVSGVAPAATVMLPDTSQTTTMTATVSEQCSITVPANVGFTVNDVSSNTDSSDQEVTISTIVLASATKQLKLSIQANTANFTPPGGSGTTWAASNVSWNNGGTWTTGTGATGTLSDSSWNEVATSTAGETTLSTTQLVFTLAAKSSVAKSGNHTLVCTWKVESIVA